MAINLISLEAVLREISDTLGDTATLGHARILVMVAASGDKGIDQGALVDRLRWSQSSAIRAIRSMSERSWSRGPDGKYKEGLSLVKSDYDPEDFRRRILTMTDTGKALINRIVGR